MSYAETRTITAITTSGGAATVYSPLPATGRILAIIYDGGLAATADLTITTETTLQGVWTETDVAASATFRAPRLATHDTVGVASLYDTVSNEPVEDYIWLVNENLKIVVAQGGDTATGVFTLIVG